MSASIFIVEDDPSIRSGIEEILTLEGYEFTSCDNGSDALEQLAEALPDLILLDVMLPGTSGYDVAKTLRAAGCRIPILMLTAKGQEVDKVVGLEAGADDYVTKPFSILELLARIRALLRRSREWQSSASEADLRPRLQVGEATIDVANYTLTLDGETTSLTPREAELLVYLAGHRGQVKSRDDILEHVWGVKYFGTTRTLDQCVAQIRKKLGDDGRKPELLLTVHGVGYKLV